jgi:ATP/maltotriose-dependent transcriptional regulator MalT
VRPPLAQTGVLLTRLLSPRLPPDCLERPALVGRVVEGTRRRLVTVLAGAGYGKSTLIAQAQGRVEPASVWISCDERLGGSADLLAHIAAGIERSVPGFLLGGGSRPLRGQRRRAVSQREERRPSVCRAEQSAQQRRTG